MRVLLDTHTLLWWLDGDTRLSRKARAAIEDPSTVVLVSAASAIGGPIEHCRLQTAD